MIVTDKHIEEHVLDALFRYAPRPNEADALRCLESPGVQDASVLVAEAVREAAMIEDEYRREEGLTPINWREFFVGGVGIGLVPGKRRRNRFEWFVAAAWNTKPHPNVEKYCAEMRIMRTMRDVRCICLGGVTVIGERQYDGKSGVQRWTLDPCEACRKLMRGKYHGLYRRKSLVLTAQPGSQLRVLKPISKLMTDHGESWPIKSENGHHKNRTGQR